MNSLHKIIDILNDYTINIPVSMRSEWLDRREKLISIAKKAVCFYAGDMSIHFDMKKKFECIPEQLMKQPYQTIWFEWNVDTLKPSKYVFGALSVDDSQTIDVHCFNKPKKLGWHYSGLGCFRKDDWSRSYDNSLTGDDLDFFRPEITANLYALTRLLCTLNCSNIITKTNKPNPKLQKKRLKNNRLPLFEYRTLHIKPSKNKKGQPQGGTHASSRVHLRRGHIREYAPGKYTWVSACMVTGGNGMIVKDYSIDGDV